MAMSKFRFALALLACCLTVTAPAFAADDSGHRLVAADVLAIKVVGQPDLETQARVDDDGTILFPFVGRIAVAGQRVDEVSRLLATALQKADVVAKPQVLVSVTTFGTQASVLGAVGLPGLYALDRQTTVTQLLARAGGLKDGAGTIVDVRRQGPSGVEVIHIDIDAVLSGKATADLTVRNNDELYVPEAPVYYLYGYVNKPGAYLLKHQLTVQQALAAGGGLSTLGSEGRIKVKRRGADGKIVETSIDLEDDVQPQDTIAVGERLF